MTRRTRYSQEVRERTVRMVFEHGDEYASEWEKFYNCDRPQGAHRGRTPHEALREKRR